MIEWKESKEKLETTLKFKNFSEAFAFISEMAIKAEDAQHHPEIHWNYNTITLTLTTHDRGSVVTRKDMELAMELSQVYADFT